MDVHPIPQNVTSFQFKLVGDMTLKQFAYLAVGVIIAYLSFVFMVHDYPLIAWPLIIVSTSLGAAFAFLPIRSRPLDQWAAAFLRAVYSPTKRIWEKNGKTFKENSLFNSRLVMYLAGGNQNYSEGLRQPESQNVGKSDNPKLRSSGAPSRSESFRTEALPTPEELQKTVDLARQAQQLQMKIIQTERTLSQIKSVAQNNAPVPVDYSQQVNKAVTDLQTLVGQASTIKQQMQTIQEPQKAQAIAEPVTREKVKVVMSNKPLQATIALTTFPNIINGIVKDKTGNYLEGVVSVIYDKEGLPVRALKTNKLGQFTGSTPLLNGTYTLELEKDGFTFDVLQIDLSGQVLPPLTITAK